MSRRPAVADSSAIIAFADIDLLDRLASLFEPLIIPPAVAREIAPTVRRPNWITVRPLGGGIDQRVLDAGLGSGETEVISLALELESYRVILDDGPARRLAVAVGLPVVGTVAILVQAKRAGILNSVRAAVEALSATDFYLSPWLIEWALDQAGESSSA